MRQKMGFWDAVASAGPYANNLHLAQTANHTNISSFQAGCSTWHPTNSVKAPTEYKLRFTSHSTQNSSVLAWYEKTKLNTTKACIYQSNEMYYNTHTHTHLFNSHFFRNTRVSRYQKGTTNLDFTQARDSERQWHQRVHVSRAPSVERRLWSAS